MSRSLSGIGHPVGDGIYLSSYGLKIVEKVNEEKNNVLLRINSDTMFFHCILFNRSTIELYDERIFIRFAIKASITGCNFLAFERCNEEKGFKLTRCEDTKYLCIAKEQYLEIISIAPEMQQIKPSEYVKRDIYANVILDDFSENAYVVKIKME